MNKHTPGPWEASRDAVPDYHTQFTVYAESSGERVATVFLTEANVTLIKAAPDLLEAAKALLAAPFGTLGDCDEYDAAMHGLEAAIARAMEV